MASPLGYESLKRQLFRLDAETAHELAIQSLESVQRVPLALQAMPRRYRRRDARLLQRFWAYNFHSPVGIAGGFDKNGRVVRALEALGFGFIEVGTVTPEPQAGNPKPRLWRIPEEASLQNALGFNNDGMEVVARRLERHYPYECPVGVNVGKNKDTPPDRAAEDYLKLMGRFNKCADYYVINVSSPNTPGLRDLQNETFIEDLLRRTSNVTNLPIMVKVSPDGDIDATVRLCECAVSAGAAGIVATNTSVDYSLSDHAREVGGISGRVIKEKSFAVFRAIAKRLVGRCMLVSVGGIETGEEAYARMRAGADLVQIYTSFVYGGPSHPGRLFGEIAQLAAEEQLVHINDMKREV